MAELGKATIKIEPDFSEVTRTMRLLAKHFTAGADAADAKSPSDKTTGAYIEIVENRSEPLERGDLIVPNEVRINGQKLFCSADEPVIVERVEANNGDLVRVTLTLLAHRVEFKDEVS